MNFYILKRLGYWRYDEYDSKVVRANSYYDARKIANSYDIGDEGKIWDNPKEVSCKKLKLDGKSEVIISSFNAG